jgi:hypothetical protein
MIEVRYENGRWCPRVICDQCRTPIKAGESPGGIAVWRGEESSDETGRTCLHLHKGQCDYQAMARQWGYTLWEDIDNHLVHLLHNFGFTTEQKLRDAKKRARELAELFA